MTTRDIDSLSPQRHDKQLKGISFDAVMEKRRLDQALNAKEFAVCAGVSYSTARSWFHLPGFPVVHGVIFWEDFLQWRSEAIGLNNAGRKNDAHSIAPSLPPRATQILLDASERC
jgi:hypothetical protein